MDDDSDDTKQFQLSFFYFFKQFLLHDQEYSSVPRDTTVCALPSKREWTILNLDAAAIMYVDGPLVNRMHPYNGHQRKLLPPVRGERKLLPHNGRCSHHHITVAHDGSKRVPWDFLIFLAYISPQYNNLSSQNFTNTIDSRPQFSTSFNFLENQKLQKQLLTSLNK